MCDRNNSNRNNVPVDPRTYIKHVTLFAQPAESESDSEDDLSEESSLRASSRASSRPMLFHPEPPHHPERHSSLAEIRRNYGLPHLPYQRRG